MLFCMDKRLRHICVLPLIVAGVLSLLCGCADPRVSVHRTIGIAQRLSRHQLGMVHPSDLARQFIAALDANNLPAAQALIANPTERHAHTLAAIHALWPDSWRDQPDWVLTVGPHPTRYALVHVPWGTHDVIPVRLQNATTNVTFSLIFQMTDTGWQLIDLRLL